MVILVFHDKWERAHQLVGDDAFVERILGKWGASTRAPEAGGESFIVGLDWTDLLWFEVYDREMNDITHEFRNW